MHSPPPSPARHGELMGTTLSLFHFPTATSQLCILLIAPALEPCMLPFACLNTIKLYLKQELSSWISPWALLKVSPAFVGWGLGSVGKANSKVPLWLPGDHFASGVDGDCSQHPQCGHERLLPICAEAGHGVSVSRGGDGLSLGAGVCLGLWGVSWVPSSAILCPQPTSLQR